MSESAVSARDEVGHGVGSMLRRDRLMQAATLILFAQFGCLIAWSTLLYHRGALTDDFAIYSQAWTLIGTGHLNPVDSLQNYEFWRNHFEMIMWPLALLHVVDSSSVILLWLQDLAIVVAEFLTFAWIRSVSARLSSRQATFIFAIAAIFTILNPSWYESVSFDVHLQVIAMPFLVGVGYALWRGKTAAAIACAGVTVLFGAVLAVFVAAIGIAMCFPLSRTWRFRRHLGPVLVTALGIAWYALVTALNADLGTELSINYGYLAGSAKHAEIAAIVIGALVHPTRLTRMFWARRWSVFRTVALGGLIGLVTPIGLLVAVVGIVPAALNTGGRFLSETGSFQTLPVVPYLVVGSVLSVVVFLENGRLIHLWWTPGRGVSNLSTHSRPRGVRTLSERSRQIAVIILCAAVVLPGAATSIKYESQLKVDWDIVGPQAAIALRDGLAQLVPSDEVIAAVGVMGLYSQRQYLYPYYLSPQYFPINTSTVAFVISEEAGRQFLPLPKVAAAIHFVVDTLGAREVVFRAGVLVAIWHPPPRKSFVILP
jgi:uncharacterized membrane protein